MSLTFTKVTNDDTSILKAQQANVSALTKVVVDKHAVFYFLLPVQGTLMLQHILLVIPPIRMTEQIEHFYD